MQIAVVDDASHDGTLGAIRREFPDILTVASSGGLYWAGAMRFGFQQFWNTEKYSYLLVFNDDCVFYPDAVSKLLEVAQSSDSPSSVVVASFRDAATGALTYGGLRRQRWSPAPVYLDPVAPTNNIQVVDTFNMNMALISNVCLKKNELIRSCFTHGAADYDFGLRVTKNGEVVSLAPGFLGECSRNQPTGTYADEELPFKQRWILLRQPKGLPFRPQFAYLKMHAPYIWPAILIRQYAGFPISHFIKRIIRMILKGLKSVNQPK